MASYGHAAPAAVPRPANYGAPYAAPAPGGSGAPAGTFSPGTKIQVGNHRVVIQKYLSEGGFAHVYLVKLPSPVNGTDQAVLKRVAVPDKESLRGMRTEVETMKRLKGHRAIVTYIDSHASELRGGGYEVFLLMEYCNGGGLIDFMNTRLQHRLTEPEILHIFADVAEGVACMHYLRPPLLHRDLKVENVLITVAGSARKFKLCDFGSAAPPRPAPTTAAECRATDEDVQKHTTMQYRSPEMVDVYRKQPIDEKSDIWALGVLLYKLCYYTTPFEDQGQLAILNASYRFPSHPVFSDRLKGLTAWMLRESPQARPNIYQVLREACAMQGREPPIKDIYSSRSQPDLHRRDQPLPDPHGAKSPPTVGAVFSPQTTQQQQVIPEVERMRRGRVPVSQSPQPNRPSPSPGKITDGDPFAALDAKAPIQGGDELSSRFPTLDQFSLLHDKGRKFEFDDGLANSPQQPKDLSQKVAERLADEAFQVKSPPSSAPAMPSPRQSMNFSNAAHPSVMSPPLASSTAPPKQPEVSRASAIISNTPELLALASPAPQPPPKPVMVSTGTMTSPILEQASLPQFERLQPNERNRAASIPRSPATGQNPLPSGGAGASRTPSFHGTAPHQTHVRYPSSSRPSLEGGRPNPEQLDPAGPKSLLATRPRPVSTHLESNLDFLREQESRSKSPALHSPRHSLERSLPSSPDEDTNIESNVDFLRAMEDSEPKKKDKGAKHHLKRGSLSSLGAGTKNILAGKFGDAFKRFEGNTSGPPAQRTPSPLKEHDRHELTPIAGSEALDGRSDDGQSPDWEEMTPEMRREQEARMLAQEEARVAAAQAEYRQRVSQRGGAGGPPIPPPKSIGGVSRVVSIQNKVQSLIDESNRSSTTVARTAQGYGHYSDAAAAASGAVKQPGSEGGGGVSGGKPIVPRKPMTGIGQQQVTGGQQQVTGGQQQQQQQQQTRSRLTSSGVEPSVTGRTTAAALTSSSTAGNKPTAPPKPTHLNKTLPITATGGGGSGGGGRPPSPMKEVPLMTSFNNLRNTGDGGISAPKIRSVPLGGGLPATSAGASEALLAVDLPGGHGSALLSMTTAEKDDYIRDFQKRFPSLGAIEMVERDLSAEGAGAIGGSGGGSGGGRR
ncbi:Serine/threonine-protein kinase ppk30 [Corynascus novoguineensis]|uniref:non-specific serine/threonine protein kinase n=1 Tax=Corynascus novoguineensis TaxID=1126955 RepID=A0AAN7D2D3_9PEZI|nr:Serine/threonine-protein kinase ppk30 [Corynascus novoguineensis]